MGSNTRHIKALTHKNLINWKRTWCSSLLEILVPIICMLAVCTFRIIEDPVELREESYLELAHAQYPVTEQAGIRWIIMDRQSKDLNNFLEFANITDSDEDLYRRDPLFFFPQHCYDFRNEEQRKADEGEEQGAGASRNRTAIGYIKNGNRVEAEFVNQLSVILQRQQELRPDLYHNYRLLTFENQQHIDIYVQDKEYGYKASKPGLCFAFEIVKKSDFRYELRLSYNDQIERDPVGAGIPRQALPTYDPIANMAHTDKYKKYVEGSFSILQNWVANTILKQQVGEDASISMITVPMRSPAFNTDPVMNTVLNFHLPIFTALSYVMPVSRMVYRMVAEKESRVRESMNMMGLTDFSYWISWLLYYSVINIVIAISSTIILSIWLLQHSKIIQVFLYFWMYGMSLFGYILFAQSFFFTARSGALFSAIIYIALYFVYLLVEQDDTPEEWKMLASLLPPVACRLLTIPFAGYESVGVGLNSENAKKLFKNYVFNNGLKMLLLDFVLLSGFGIYLDAVMPRKYGSSRPWTYVCQRLTPSYWDCFDVFKGFNLLFCCKRKKHEIKQSGIEMGPVKEWSDNDDKSLHYEFETKYMKKENFEEPDLGLLELEKRNRFLKIEDLKKNYDGFRAVDGINCRMYEGQIFALLGHNGAGKTTTLHMLTGMIKASEGKATVYGYNTFGQDLDDVRRIMGVCPQHDILFDLLTPYELLNIFQEFKGYREDDQTTKEQKKQEIEKLLKDVGLWEMKDTKAKNLSGGSRRKLSVAIALCGNSKYIMLDEPTAGMDLQARRNLWNMLRAYRPGRIIILTTHYMDEADVLGDRIGIMNNGKLVTVGGSLFLKKRYGVGYNLTMVKDPDFSTDDIDLYLKTNLKSEEVRKLSEIGREVTFQIPVECSDKFKKFFADFDIRLDQLGINGYGISITTLEEVFLRVGDGRDLGEIKQTTESFKFVDEGKDEDQKKLINGEPQTESQVLEEYSISNGRSIPFLQNLLALLSKRMTIWCRLWFSSLCQILIPAALVAIGFYCATLVFFYDSPSKEITTKLFPLPQHILMNREPILREQNATILEANQWADNSVLALYENLPSSYTLVTDEDFRVTYQNYTQDYMNYLESKEAGELGEAQFDLFKHFDDVIFGMKDLEYTVLQDSEVEIPKTTHTFGSYLVYEANTTTNQYKVITYVNTTSQDVAAAFPQFMYESILKTATGESNFQFKTVIEPFPIFQAYKDQDQSVSSLALIYAVSVGFSIVPAVIIGQLMAEREKNLKHMQSISGLSIPAYWIVNLWFDISKAMIPMMISVGLLFIPWFALDDYQKVWPVFLAFPFGMVPFTHACSFCFTREWAAQAFIVFLNIIFMMAVPTIVYFFQADENLTLYGEYIAFYSRIWPGFNVSKALLFAGTAEAIARAQADFEEAQQNQMDLGNLDSEVAFVNARINLEPWHWDNLKGDMVALGGHFVLGIIALLFWEGLIYQSFWLLCCRCNRRSKTTGPEIIDKDVQEEEERILTGPKDLPVRVSKLRKVYGRKVAVERASFGLDYGECFTLLGVNGAGKTTTFKTLTNDIVPSGGEVSIGGYNTATSFRKARQLVGYCPQHDVIFEPLTVIEHLQFYCRLKGVSLFMQKKLIDQTIEKMNLEAYRYKQAGMLSGGNKRKLQVAIAIIGNPPIVLLDEPSAGMDPEARRFMWSVVAGLTQKKNKSAVLLTTHSMEEAEALSTKMGIMVTGGVFKCFGSTQHIKNKFGTGYEIEVKIKPMSDEVLNDMLWKYQIEASQFKMTALEAQAMLGLHDVPSVLIQEIKEGGLGDELIREAADSKTNVFRTVHLMDWLYRMEQGLKIVLSLAEVFQTVELLEQYNDYFKLRVLRQDKTIGFVFGLMENQKDKIGIAEYSASQTTLEQIFQMFANMGLDDQKGHLIFKHNPEEKGSLSIVKSSQMSGPMSASAFWGPQGQQMQMHSSQIDLLGQPKSIESGQSVNNSAVSLPRQPRIL